MNNFYNATISNRSKINKTYLKKDIQTEMYL